MLQHRICLATAMQFFEQKTCQEVSKRVTLYPGWRLFDGSWAPLVLQTFFCDTENVPTALPKCPQGPKMMSATASKVQANILKVFLKVKLLENLKTN